MMSPKHYRRTAATERLGDKGVLSTIKGWVHWDPFDGIPTKEEYLAAQAYKNLLKITKSTPDKEKLKMRGDVAKDLIVKISRDGNHEQAMEMWRVFHRELHEYVTDKDQPVARES